MLKGTVTFTALVIGAFKIHFDEYIWQADAPQVEKVSIRALDEERPPKNTIKATVHLASVETKEEGGEVAMKVINKALDLISFHFNLSIDKAIEKDASYEPLNPEGGKHIKFCGRSIAVSVVATGGVMSPTLSELQDILEGVTVPDTSSTYLRFFRSARRSESSVEEFMHLYNILLYLNGDSQDKVDACIKRYNSKEQLAPSPVQS